MTDNVTVQPIVNQISSSVTQNNVTNQQTINQIALTQTANNLTLTPTVNEIILASLGLQGPPGPTGATGAAGTNGTNGTNGNNGVSGGSFVFEQQSNAIIWNVTHNLGYRPAVTIQDYGKITIEGDLSHTDVNHLVLTFSEAVSGYAYLS